MTPEQIHQLLDNGDFPEPAGKRELLETHISWVILCGRFAYKIKKPLRYSFLDFSTPDRRLTYCERELALNRRFAPDIYLDVLPVKLQGDHLHIGPGDGDTIDHALRMRKLDRERQMDILLQHDQVTPQDMENLAHAIAAFHRSADIISEKDYTDVGTLFRDLESEREYLAAQLPGDTDQLIDRALAGSASFMQAHDDLLTARLRDGFTRDCHGDLHARNIFLLPAPQPFDCIEFNDEFRRIDVLNDVAFLCMDLDALGRADLGELFLRVYNDSFAAMRNEAERHLFVYYKAYRANIRAKVNSLRARSAGDDSDESDTEKSQALASAKKYLRLMSGYMDALGD